MSTSSSSYCPNCGGLLRTGVNYCSFCGELINLNLANSLPRSKRGTSTWKVILYIILGLIAVYFIANCVERFTAELNYEEPDTTTTPEHRRNIELKRHMQYLVNEARREAGVPRVSLGRNNAAQLHAEQSVEECAASHWDRYGLKPYMRYSLTGGYNYNAENVAYYYTCGEDIPWYLADEHDDMESVMEGLVELLLDSPGHRETMLHPEFSKMNVGISWDKRSINIVQHFESNVVRFTQEPALNNGILSMQGEVRGLPDFNEDNSLALVVSYDLPPERMELNRLARTYCYSEGKPFLVKVPRPEHQKADVEATETFTVDLQQCPDPYAMAPNIPWPTSMEEMEALGKTARARVREKSVEYELQLETSGGVKVEGSEFQIRDNIKEHLETKGPGVYTVLLVGDFEDGREVAIAQKSFFYKVSPPSYYTAN